MAKRCAAGEGELQGNEEMISPAKKLCTSAVSGLRRIAVEGNIAAGKSTFLRLLKESSPAYHVISEPITKWQNVDSPGDSVTASQQCGGNLLDMFYREPKRWAYTFQTYACLSRLKAQLRQLPQEVTSQPNSTIFFERSVHSDKSAHSYRLQYTRISTAFLLCIIYAVLVARACYVCYIRTKLTCDEEVCFCICLCV
ncbi:Deoxycytidine kinase 2 [Geodia barretti]|uniref:Deoxycytidine kinase 2 n=1 Tax=Geodia barretti TaxID=519541 RepID=A0AA35QVY2_GEOBA|nr:Deoxycytidine kinase 2 [Geodia barretti]